MESVYKNRSYVCCQCSVYPKERGLVSLSCLLAGNAVTACLGSVSKQVLVFQCVMIV